MTHFKNFIGLWELEPALNEYTSHNGPQSGSYRISALDGLTAQFDMTWTDANGEQHDMNYISILDGKQYPYENPAVAEFIESHADMNTMVTRSYKNGKIIAVGTRRLSDDGNTMFVTQEAFLPDGNIIINKSVYYKR